MLCAYYSNTLLPQIDLIMKISTGNSFLFMIHTDLYFVLQKVLKQYRKLPFIIADPADQTALMSATTGATNR